MKQYIVKIINSFIDITRKKKIFEIARKSGKDCDGDIVRYKDTTYYVHLFGNVLKRI